MDNVGANFSETLLELDLATKLSLDVLPELTDLPFNAALKSKASASIDSTENEDTDHDLGINSSTNDFSLQPNSLSLGSDSGFNLTPTLNAGNYVQDQVGETNDNLTLSTTSESTSGTTFNQVYGYGLVDAAAAVAEATGQSAFSDVSNVGGDNWGNDLVKAPEAWANGYTGEGVTVAVIDTGVDVTHEDLSSNIWQNTGEIFGNGLDDDGNGYADDICGWNFASSNHLIMPETSFLPPGTPAKDAFERLDHGTHVAGTIAGMNNDFGVTGVAYDAQIMPIKLLGFNEEKGKWGSGSLTDAIKYAVDNGADVINMSLGKPGHNTADVQGALAYAESHNVVTVTSAGNAMTPEEFGVHPSPDYPAAFATDYGLSVGAVDSSGTIANFSYGAGSDSSMQHVVAPGVNIRSTLPGDNYYYKQGTSMAAPHVAGVAALMLDANPNLTADQVCQALTGNATSLGGSLASTMSLA